VLNLVLLLSCVAVWAASLLSCMTGCSLYMIVYVYMYYMLVRLSGCFNHIKGTIIIIISRISSNDKCIQFVTLDLLMYRRLNHFFLRTSTTIPENSKHSVLKYGPCVTMGSLSFTCHPHANHTCLYSPAARHHCPLAGTHCAYPRRNDQAELTWVADHTRRYMSRTRS